MPLEGEQVYRGNLCSQRVKQAGRGTRNCRGVPMKPVS